MLEKPYAIVSWSEFPYKIYTKAKNTFIFLSFFLILISYSLVKFLN